MELVGRAAVIVPAWREAEVIGEMILHTLRAWSQRDFRLYVGCYCNDDATLAAAIAAAEGDPRIRIVVHGAHGPTTKADCLNRLYEALCADEARSGVPFRSIVMQDAEDMVHPAGLLAIDRALEDADFVQLPVRPELQSTRHGSPGTMLTNLSRRMRKTFSCGTAWAPQYLAPA